MLPSCSQTWAYDQQLDPTAGKPHVSAVPAGLAGQDPQGILLFISGSAGSHCRPHRQEAHTDRRPTQAHHTSHVAQAKSSRGSRHQHAPGKEKMKRHALWWQQTPCCPQESKIHLPGLIGSYFLEHCSNHPMALGGPCNCILPQDIRRGFPFLGKKVWVSQNFF